MGKTEIDFSTIQEAGAIRRQILDVQSKGKMNVIHVFGEPGTGKSWSCIRLAELISMDLHGENRITEDNIVDSLLGLLKFIRKIKRDGEIVIGEEIAVWMNSRRAMSAENVDAGYVWDTLRKKRVIIIGNNPVRKDVDGHFRTAATMSIQTLSLNKQKGITIVKPMRLQTNPDTGKTYRHRLKDKGYEVHRCWTGKPKKETTDAYEAKKDEFLEKLYERLERKHEQKLAKEVGSISSAVELPTKLEQERFQLSEKGLTHQEIADFKGIARVSVTNSIVGYKRKMENLKNIKNM